MPQFKRSAENLVVNTDSGIYYLQAKVNGNKVRKSLYTDSLKIAKMKRDDMLRKLRAQSPRSKDSKNMTLKECIELARAYYSEIPSYKKKPASMHYREQCLGAIESRFPNRAISTISKKETHDRFTEIASHYSAQRFNNILGTFRKVMSFAIRSHARFDDPSEEIKRLRIVKKELIMPTRDEFMRAIESIRSQRKANSEQAANMSEFIAYSGMRAVEASNVRFEDIDSEKILVHGGEQGTKNHDIRYVQINSAMRDLLKRMQSEPGQPLFTLKTPRYALQNAYDRLEIKQSKVVHGLRHLFATTCLESGVDPATIAKWLGHHDGGKLVLETYGHIRDEHSRLMAAKVKF